MAEVELPDPRELTEKAERSFSCRSEQFPLRLEVDGLAESVQRGLEESL